MLAKDFANEQALEEYLKQHPKGKRENHRVVKSEPGKTKTPEAPAVKTPSKTVPTAPPTAPAKVTPDSTAPTTPKPATPTAPAKPTFDEEASKKKENIQIPGWERVEPAAKERIHQYNLDIVGDDKTRAVEIAKKITAGIEKTADVCTVSPPVCEGNLGIPRNEMPQILGDASIPDMLKSDDPKEKAKAEAAVSMGADPEDTRTIMQQMLDHFKKGGTKISKDKVPVGKLKATQREIQAAKTIGMADAHLRGKFDNIDDSVIISSDNHILDGHHRWAALLTINPDREMNVIRVDMPMRELLKKSMDVPGVFKADLQGNIVPKEKKAASSTRTALTAWQRSLLSDLSKDQNTYNMDNATVKRLKNIITDETSRQAAEMLVAEIMTKVIREKKRMASMSRTAANVFAAEEAKAKAAKARRTRVAQKLSKLLWE